MLITYIRDRAYTNHGAYTSIINPYGGVHPYQHIMHQSVLDASPAAAPVPNGQQNLHMMTGPQRESPGQTPGAEGPSSYRE